MYDNRELCFWGWQEVWPIITARDIIAAERI